ncbi:MAG: hypothetical protein ACPLW9_00545 [Minisyncoccales bacterium]
MLQLVALIIFISSFLGLVFIVYRQLPILVQLPVATTSFLNWRERWLKIKTWPFWKNFSLEKILQKILSKIRILTLKIDHKIANCLQRLRERIKKKKTEENLSTPTNDQVLENNNKKQDDYWQEIKKFKKK